MGRGGAETKSALASKAVTFQLETVGGTWEEAFPLLLAHHREVGVLPQERFRPDKAFYENLEKFGALLVFTLRDAGKVCGYGTFTVLPVHAHYPDSVWARQDSLYVDPPHRGKTALDFIKYQDDQLRWRFPSVEIVRQCTPRKDFGSLLKLLGYREMETSYLLDRAKP